jgi:hypothetical protein
MSGKVFVPKPKIGFVPKPKSGRRTFTPIESGEVPTTERVTRIQGVPLPPPIKSTLNPPQPGKIVRELKEQPVIVETVGKPKSMDDVSTKRQPEDAPLEYKPRSQVQMEEEAKLRAIKSKMLKWETKKFISESLGSKLTSVKYNTFEDRKSIVDITGDIVINIPMKPTNSIGLKGSLNDARMGAKSTEEICATCQNTIDACLGHPGRIDLTFVIYNVGFFEELLKVLACICLKCSEPLIMSRDEESIKEILNTEPSSRIDRLKKMSEGIACRCGGTAYSYAINESTDSKPKTVKINGKSKDENGKPIKIDVPIEFIERVLMNIDDKAAVDRRYQMVFSFGGAKMIRYLTYAIVVIAPRYRLPQTVDGTQLPNELTKAYNSIIIANNELAAEKMLIEGDIIKRQNASVDFRLITPTFRQSDDFLDKDAVNALPIFTAYDL